LAEFLIVRK